MAPSFLTGMISSQEFRDEGACSIAALPVTNGNGVGKAIKAVPEANGDVLNPALVVTADHRIKMVNCPIPSPGPGEVLLKIKATGICGSDIHFWKKGEIGELKVLGDCVLGHESAGIIMSVGANVPNFVPGDRVAVEPGVPCGFCEQTREGRYNLCEDVKFSGVYPYNGSCTRYFVHPASHLFKLPDSLSYSEGALLEPLSVVLHALRTAPPQLGRPALICGAGPIGLLNLAAARASGATPLVILDIEPKRLEFAAQYVPGTMTYLIDPKKSPKTCGGEIRQLFLSSGAGELPRVAYECTGIESSVNTAAFTVRRGGTVMVVGVGRPEMKLAFMHISLAEINLKFINRYTDTWPAGIAALSSGIIDVKPLVTHKFKLEDAVDAMQQCADTSRGSIKVHIVDEEE